MLMYVCDRLYPLQHIYNVQHTNTVDIKGHSMALSCMYVYLLCMYIIYSTCLYISVSALECENPIFGITPLMYPNTTHEPAEHIQVFSCVHSL